MHALYYSRDPGATNQLIAVYEMVAGRLMWIQELNALGSALARSAEPPLVLARPPGLGMWHRARVDAKAMEAAPRLVDLTQLLQREGAGAIVTGTSDIDDETDRLLWRAAREVGIPSHCFIDHPANLAARFTLQDGSSSWPSYLYAPDEGIAAELKALSVEAGKVTVCGWLHHCRMKQLARSTDAATTENLRQQWGADATTAVVLFVSECGREMVAQGRHSAYDEVDMLDDLLARMARPTELAGLALSPENALVVVRPHPRDRQGKYDSYKNATAKCPRLIISQSEAPEVALLAADLVVGMDSSLLHEARALGLLTHSLLLEPSEMLINET
ncbi:MAG: hypothetical protein ACR2PA_04015 [Hyphomicrobiaceae bacterium]